MDFQTDNRFVFHYIRLLPLIETVGRQETASGRQSIVLRDLQTEIGISVENEPGI